jgi:hypothetical protein
VAQLATYAATTAEAVCRSVRSAEEEVRRVKRKCAMNSIVQANIDRFRMLLESESDPAKRSMIVRLLAEEEVKLSRQPQGKKEA